MKKDIWQRLFDEEDEDGGGGGGGGAAAVADDPAARLAAMQAEIDSLKKLAETEKQRATEQETNARYWHEEAKKKDKAAPAAADSTPAADPADDIDPIEALSKGGTAALDAILAKRGFVKGDAVNARVEERAQQLVIEAQLAKQFPEINDQNSPFFKDTATEYGKLVAQGVPHMVAMQQAPKNVRLQQIEAGTYETPKAKAEREERAAAASGDKTRKAAPKDEDSEELTPFQQTIIEQMCPEDMKLEDFRKAYIRNAKKGVNFVTR